MIVNVGLEQYNIINADLLLIRALGTNFRKILIKIQNFSKTKMHLKMTYAKWRPFCLDLYVLIKSMTAPMRLGFTLDTPEGNHQGISAQSPAALRLAGN